MSLSHRLDASVAVPVQIARLFNYRDDQARLGSQMQKNRQQSHLLGLVFAPIYARWCVTQMTRDAVGHFAEASSSASTRS